MPQVKQTADKMIAQTTIIEMGWTKALIAKFLPEPTLKPNPHYKKAAPMKLWKESDVLAVMQMDDFLDALEKTNERRKTAQKAISTKKENLSKRALELAKSLRISIIPDNELRKKTLEAKQSWYDYLADIGKYHFYNDICNVDTDTMNRWVVNYIRHNLIDYDAECRYLLYGHVGKDDAYIIFKQEILLRIADAYPAYAEECKDQITFLRGYQ